MIKIEVKGNGFDKVVKAKNIEGIVIFMDAFASVNVIDSWKMTFANGNESGSKSLNALADFFYLYG